MTLGPWMLVGAALWAATPVKPVVAVLPFENHTGDPALAPLGKGLADMLVTDLAALPSITVVERARLQSVLDELQLQRSSFFDASTVGKVGRGLGASHLVAGSMLEVADKVRLDAHVVEVSTGKVSHAVSAAGARAAFLDLHAQLVAGLSAGFTPARAQPAVQTRAATVDVALQYGTALDQADGGNLEAAQQTLAQVTRKAPLFGLARVRQQDVAQRIAEARERRDRLGETDALALLTEADEALALDPAGASGKVVRQRLAWRYTRGHLLLRVLRPSLTAGPFALVLPKAQDVATGTLQSFWANTDALLLEWSAYAAQHTQTLPGGGTFLDPSVALPPAAAERARRLGLPFFSTVPLARRERLMVFQTGWVPATVDAHRYQLAPVPVALLPARSGAVDAELRALLEEADALAPKGPPSSFDAVNLRVDGAQALIELGREEDAAVLLQEVLDNFPQSQRFAFAEERLRQLAGLAHNNALQSLRGFSGALATCEEMPIRKGLSEVLRRRMLLHGAAAWEQTEREVLAACPGPARASLRQCLHVTLGGLAASHLQCDVARHHLDRFVAEGGSASDARGYRHNHSPQCFGPMPPP